MAAWVRGRPTSRIALVPTMGALHDGHVSLMRVAQSLADVTVVSIFVNPLQFERTDDFDGYPRPIDGDLALCEQVGVDAVYAPTAAAMYPPGFQTHVEPGALAAPLEGAGRPGHFRGVATVVTKLFGAVRPDLAVFGEKDFQQLAIIRRMARDLDTGIEIVAAPTVREPDGLALSSRNRRLTHADRRAAVVVSRALCTVRDAHAEGERDANQLTKYGLDVLAGEPLARPEYFSIDDAIDLTPVLRVDRAAVVSTAVWFGEVRLIDNVVIGS
jgi:pantoate--beta-alanine ligase